jgi:hypothetical protein
MFSFKREKGRKEFTQGVKYYGQQKYAQAEQLLRQSAEQREKVLGFEANTGWHLRFTTSRSMPRQSPCYDS